MRFFNPLHIHTPTIAFWSLALGSSQLIIVIGGKWLFPNTLMPSPPPMPFPLLSCLSQLCHGFPSTAMLFPSMDWHFARRDSSPILLLFDWLCGCDCYFLCFVCTVPNQPVTAQLLFVGFQSVAFGVAFPHLAVMKVPCRCLRVVFHHYFLGACITFTSSSSFRLS